jgi:hypothetical protein
MERTKVYTEEYLRILNDQLRSHPGYMEGIKFNDIRPDLKYSYIIFDPTRSPNMPSSPEEQMKVEKVFQEVIAKVNEKYELIRV